VEPEQSLKSKAQEIITTIDQELQQKPDTELTVVEAQGSRLMKIIFGVISDVDMKAAAQRVKLLRERYPNDTPPQLSQRLIRAKCERTGAVGAITSGAGLIPGLGTAAAMTLGVAADIGATFKYQAELVLEIAAVYDYPLTEEEKERLVLLITGLSAGASTLARRAGQKAAVTIGEKFAEKSVLKALPVIGVIASAGTNALSTYIIGQRADAYFRLGPDAVGSWEDSLRTITGVDERKLGGWLAEGGKSAGQAGQMAGRGVATYFSWVLNFIKTILGLLWTVVTFIPRQIGRLWSRGGGQDPPPSSPSPPGAQEETTGENHDNPNSDPEPTANEQA
jgi:hypothetical protein